MRIWGMYTMSGRNCQSQGDGGRDGAATAQCESWRGFFGIMKDDATLCGGRLPDGVVCLE